jgi:hypothetical protein
MTGVVKRTAPGEEKVLARAFAVAEVARSRGEQVVRFNTWPRCVWWPLPSEALPRTVERR